MPPTVQKAPAFRFKLFLALSLLISAFAGTALAQQAGASSAADSRTRYLSERGLLPESREVAVEEIINYRRHQIWLPRAGEAVALDVRWGNAQAAATNREAVLQVGFSTALANDRRELRPINLSLVIDKSGSMADANKISRVKESLLTMVSQLRETDVLSIVVFDSEAQVLMPARTVGDREAVKRLIRSIEPGSATNLHAGLMLGYKEALKNYRKDTTSRVIVSPVASEPNVQIDYDEGFELEKLYGYEPQIRGNSVALKLDNMNSGLTQVIMLRFRLRRGASYNSRLPVNVRFTYYDLEQKQRLVRTEAVYLIVKEGSAAGDWLKDGEVAKNYSIALLAQAIHDMALAAEANRLREAEKILTAAIAGTYQRYPNLEDEDITHTLMVAQKYQEVLRKQNKQSQKRG